MGEKAELRRKRQLEILGSGIEIELGDIKKLPLSIEEIKKIDKNSNYVSEYFGGGLTGEVFKISVNGKDYTLKKVREEILVKNIDGQTSFLNEVQRRKDFERAKQEDKEAYKAVVNTIYASLNHGFILSEWIEGEKIYRYNREIYKNIFNTMLNVEISGNFECDYAHGNLLIQEDGTVRIFDFGYMYPFDIRNDYNSDGKEIPLFHIVERFETRNYMQYLMDLGENYGIKLVLKEFREEKEEAISVYKKKLEYLDKNNGSEDIKNWISSFIKLWEQGIETEKSLKLLYDLESFRSYVLDIEDDLGGKSCNPDTMKKLEKVIETLEKDYDYLKMHNGFFWGDEKLSENEILKKYKEMRVLIEKYQLKNNHGFIEWKADIKRKMIESI